MEFLVIPHCNNVLSVAPQKYFSFAEQERPRMGSNATWTGKHATSMRLLYVEYFIAIVLHLSLALIRILGYSTA